MKYLYGLGTSLLVMLSAATVLVGQDARVEIGKHANAIPRVCESVVPANIDGTVDIPALVKEAYCKGAGDMLADYTYVTNSLRREKDKKGKEKEETFTYEVFFPTLKSGMRAKGIMVTTSHNGVPVPAAEVEKARQRAAERTEKEEAKIASEASVPPAASSNTRVGMLPLGMYAHTTMSHQSFGRKHSATLAIHTFLKNCDLTLARREQIGGRETLIFSFTPRADAKFADDEKYIAQLKGEIWIDAKDRIVIRLVGWPASVPATANLAAVNTPGSTKGAAEMPPAVFVEMLHLDAGIWLPRMIRVNGADYPTLFDGITADSSGTYSNFIRFSTEIQDVTTTPKK
jgi:hypothetical protein